MLGRIFYGAAAAALALALIGLHAESRRIERAPVTLSDGSTGVVYLPAPDRSAPHPVVVMVPGYAANAGAMDVLARRLAGVGYAALTIDLPGHGSSRARFPVDADGTALRIAIEMALERIVEHPDLDAERVALLGHSIGASAALQMALWNPSVLRTVVGISTYHVVDGPYAAPNTLLLWGSWEMTRIRRAGRELGAQLAGHSQLVAGRTYGNPDVGDAVRIEEVDATTHPGMLYSRDAAQRIASWLDVTLAPARGIVAAQPRLAWAALGALAALVLVWLLPRALRAPVVALPPSAGARAILPWLACLLVGALPLIGTDAVAGVEPLGFVSLAGGGPFVAWLSVSGVLALAWGARAGRVPLDGLGDRGTWLAAGCALLFGYLALGVPLSAWLDIFPGPHRVLPIVLLFALLLPHFAALEWGLRTSGNGVAVLGRLAVVPIIGLAALFDWIPRPELIPLQFLLLASLPLELFAAALARTRPNPWLAALIQSASAAWILGTLMPYAGR